MKKSFFLLFWVVLGCGLVYAQSGQLALNYAEQGEYEKAILVYQKALKNERGNPKLLAGLVKSYQQIEKYEEAAQELKFYVDKVVDKGFLIVELGYNEQLRGNESLASQYYDTAIKGVEANTMNTHLVATTFQSHSLLKQAVEAYEAGAKANENANYNIQLAKLYGELGEVQKMYDAYLNLINKNPNYAAVAQRTFATYVTEDPLNEANIIFRKTILKRLQTEQNVLYNELLSWLFIQQKDYQKAFVQEKAIYKRTDGSFNGLVNLADIAIEDKAYNVAEEILIFLKEHIVNEDVQYESEQKLLQIAIENASTIADKEAIKTRFEGLLQKPDIDSYAVPIQINYAHFVAFNMDNPEDALDYLKQEVTKPRNRFDEARLKMELADILVLKEKFNQALIYYSQVQNKVKNNIISQEARFKVAKTSYYKGDFDWAEQQLDVLKRGNTQLIANDALELLLVIRDNSMEDSLQTALKKYARGDLLTYQNKPEEAIKLYDQILEDHKGEKIEDETLLAQAKLYEAKNAFAKAEKNYLTIIAYYSDGILADDAYYRLARLYEGPLNDIEKAKANYERIIFDLADSIYYVEAQKRFRNLRGDAIN